MSGPPKKASSPSKSPKLIAELSAEDLRSFLFDNTEINVATGRLEILGTRLMLLRPELLVSIQKQLEMTIGVSAKGLLYRAGEQTGLSALPMMADRIRETPTGKDSGRPLRWFEDLWSALGFGRVRFRDFDPAQGKASFRFENGAFPEAYGPSAHPVCHLWAGWAAGAIRHLFGREVLCDEVRCRATGAPACEFDVRPYPGP